MVRAPRSFAGESTGKHQLPEGCASFRRRAGHRMVSAICAGRIAPSVSRTVSGLPLSDAAPEEIAPEKFACGRRLVAVAMLGHPPRQLPGGRQQRGELPLRDPGAVLVDRPIRTPGSAAPSSTNGTSHPASRSAVQTRREAREPRGRPVVLGAAQVAEIAGHGPTGLNPCAPPHTAPPNARPTERFRLPPGES